MMMCQGVDAVLATPHFYANDESVEAFLERRESSIEKLREKLPKEAPQIIPAAEVRYYPGIGRMDGLEQLRIGDTKLLLLEMSVSKWTEYTVKEIIDIAGNAKFRVIIAHVERYLPLQARGVWERLLEAGVLMQSNAEFFLGFTTKRKALSLLGDGYIHFIGTDSHNTTSRAPKIGNAYEVITKKFGNEFTMHMNEFGYAVLGQYKK